ncbi:MAG: Xaa-Pro peptidase family protein [Candidatus Micrarchaeia archaeon]
MLPDLKLKIKWLFDKSKVDCILIMNQQIPDPNFFYFTRMSKSDFSHAVLILTRKRTILIVPKMEYRLALTQCKKKAIKVVAFETVKDIGKIIRKYTRGKRIGLNFSRISVNNLKLVKRILNKIRIVDISKNLVTIRRTKTKEEAKNIYKACRIASKVMREVPNIIRPGMKERNIAAEIDKKLRLYGADEIAFPTIVVAGRNSSNPHYTAGDNKIKKGDLIIVDFGCKINNYCSDITRTFIIGKPSCKQAEMLDTCKKMQEEIVALLKPGTDFENLQKRANNICEKKYGKLLHMVGHSIGIEVHDPLGDTKKLEEGEVLAIEPAIYLENIGGVRIEDNFIITSSGCKRLTKGPMGQIHNK